MSAGRAVPAFRGLTCARCSSSSLPMNSASMRMEAGHTGWDQSTSRSATYSPASDARDRPGTAGLYDPAPAGFGDHGVDPSATRAEADPLQDVRVVRQGVCGHPRHPGRRGLVGQSVPRQVVRSCWSSACRCTTWTSGSGAPSQRHLPPRRSPSRSPRQGARPVRNVAHGPAPPGAASDGLTSILAQARRRASDSPRSPSPAAPASSRWREELAVVRERSWRGDSAAACPRP